MIVKLNDNNLSEGYYSDEGYNEVLHVLENLSLQEGATFTFSSENNGIIDATFANNKFGTIIISLNCDNLMCQIHISFFGFRNLLIFFPYTSSILDKIIDKHSIFWNSFYEFLNRNKGYPFFFTSDFLHLLQFGKPSGHSSKLRHLSIYCHSIPPFNNSFLCKKYGSSQTNPLLTK